MALNSTFNFFDKIKDSIFGQEKDLDNNDIKTKYIACMVLAGVGDAMGYNNGMWEFCKQGTTIHQEVEAMGGVPVINTTAMGVSDDQVMHLATAEALIEANTLEELFRLLATHYVKSFDDMQERGPGHTTAASVDLLSKGTNWHEIPYSANAKGCGGAMRAMCIGLVYYGDKQRDNLIAASIESGRITHNNPIGFLGALVSALFTAYALEGVPMVQWGRKMVQEILPRAREYLKEGKHWEDYQKDVQAFEDKWKNYLEKRKIWEGDEPLYPLDYEVEERDEEYNGWSERGWGGSCGDDAPMIAYDALLYARDNWVEWAMRGILHGGDNDSTGCIGSAWFGILYGFKNVPHPNYRAIEYRQRAEEAGVKLLEKAQKLDH